MRASAIEIGTTRQLFADAGIVESVEHVFQVPHHGRKHAANPLVRADQPIEESRALLVYGTALHDPDAAASERFRLWYNQIIFDYGERDHAGLLYARSPDGIHWEKPRLGVAAVNGNAAHNGLWTNNSRGYHSTQGICHNPHHPDQDRRYALLGFLGVDQPQVRRPGWGAFFSRDGIHWAPYAGNPVVAYDHLSVCEAGLAVYNEQSARPRPGHPLDTWQYYGSVKYSSYMGQDIPDGGFGRMRRAAGIMTSHDFVSWSPNFLVLQPDAFDDFLCRQRVLEHAAVLRRSRPEQQRAEFYGMALMPAGDILLGLLWVFDSSGSVEAEGGNQEGPTHVQLVGTRDLRHWQRLGERLPILSPGEPGAWDGGSVYTCNRPIVVGDEIWLYYAGFDQGHILQPDVVGAIGLATWRLDGFVSMSAYAQEGEVTCRPVHLEGSGLEINACTRGGEVAVELLDAAGAPIPGFTAAECRPFRGDDVRHRIHWTSGRNLQSVSGTTARLRFLLRQADLYSFALTG